MLYYLVLVALASAINASALPHPSGRIVGGKSTTITNYPYQVSLETPDRYYTCGGSIISAHYIITAGRCVKPEEDLKVRAGSTYKGWGGSVHQVIKIHRHEKFGGNGDRYLVNDIAIMRVKEPFVFDDTRQPIKLFEADDHALAGVMSVITGWGATDYGYPNQLHTVTVPIVSKRLCNIAYKHWGGLRENQICAGFYGVGGKGSCVGDYGSPLAINGRLAGIVSYGDGCGEPEYPGVYTEVTAYRYWIRQYAGV